MAPVDGTLGPQPSLRWKICPAPQPPRRENWLSSKAQEIIKDAIEDEKIGPDRALAFVLHEGLGLSLEIIAKATGVTKSMVEKRVTSGRKRIAAKQVKLAAA